MGHLETQKSVSLPPAEGERARVRGPRCALNSDLTAILSPHPSPKSSPLRGERRKSPGAEDRAVTRQHTRPADSLPPAEGERGRVRGVRRTRTTGARDFARHLRRESTDAEKRLWRLLRDRRFADFKFRRQYASGIYFLDFFCVTAHLAVELDGGGHGFPDQRARDAKRNHFLSEQGIEVRRFWNHQVRREAESVRFEIWHALMERTGRKQEIANFLPNPIHPSPQSSPLRGERRKTAALLQSSL